MSEKELEERVMLSKENFLEIKKYLQHNYPKAVIIHQKNRYFDDANLTIKNSKNMLRIRSLKNVKFREFTYKVKGENGDTEYTQLLSHYWFNQITHFSRLPDCEVKEKLLSDGVDINSLKMTTELLTRRMQIQTSTYIIALDVNVYNGIVDYDLEIESFISKQHATEIILMFCIQFGMVYDPNYVTKSARAFNSIKK